MVNRIEGEVEELIMTKTQVGLILDVDEHVYRIRY